MLLPSGSEALHLNEKDYRFVDGFLPHAVRVTVDREFYEMHSDSVEFWTPGSPTVSVRADRYGFQRQGRRSSTFVILWSGVRAMMSASKASGSTPLSLAVSIRVYAMAADFPPASEPTKR